MKRLYLFLGILILFIFSFVFYISYVSAPENISGTEIVNNPDLQIILNMNHKSIPQSSLIIEDKNRQSWVEIFTYLNLKESLEELNQQPEKYSLVEKLVNSITNIARPKANGEKIVVIISDQYAGGDELKSPEDDTKIEGAVNLQFTKGITTINMYLNSDLLPKEDEIYARYINNVIAALLVDISSLRSEEKSRTRYNDYLIQKMNYINNLFNEDKLLFNINLSKINR